MLEKNHPSFFSFLFSLLLIFSLLFSSQPSSRLLLVLENVHTFVIFFSLSLFFLLISAPHPLSPLPLQSTFFSSPAYILENVHTFVFLFSLFLFFLHILFTFSFPFGQPPPTLMLSLSSFLYPFSPLLSIILTLPFFSNQHSSRLSAREETHQQTAISPPRRRYTHTHTRGSNCDAPINSPSLRAPSSCARVNY